LVHGRPRESPEERTGDQRQDRECAPVRDVTRRESKHHGRPTFDKRAENDLSVLWIDAAVAHNGHTTSMG
jgi:hypothetical protein